MPSPPSSGSPRGVTLGRLATFMAILAASAAVAAELVKRHERASAARERSARAVVAARSSRPESSASAASSQGPPPPFASAVAAIPARQSAGVVEDPLTDALCPSGMLLVDGTTCASRPRKCKEFDHGVCGRFDAAECRKGQALRFCVDRYEYPNLEGVVPAAMATFEQARAACDEEGKRLCTETEWRFACEGREGFEFPYGDARDPDACNVGRSSEAVRPDALWEARDVSRVLARVDRRVASGTMLRCTSPFGVRDMTGNLEEWGTGSSGIESALLGGNAADPAPLCGTVRKTRQTAFRSPHTGFRCCRDPLVRAAPRPSAGVSGF